MVKLSKNELRKLQALCNERRSDAEWHMKKRGANSMGKELARLEKEYMESIILKLEEVITSDAKRIEIVK